jgi:hypothetical protein
MTTPTPTTNTTTPSPVTFKARNVYGNELHYPMCNVGVALCMLNGTKTLTMAIERIAPSLGFRIVKQG